MLNNIRLNNVPTAVVTGGATLLAGGTTTITSWALGNVFRGTSSTGTYTRGSIAAPNKPSVLLDSSGRIFGKTRPQYANYAVSQFVSVRDQGARGDGTTDDTAALQAVLNNVSLHVLMDALGSSLSFSVVWLPNHLLRRGYLHRDFYVRFGVQQAPQCADLHSRLTIPAGTQIVGEAWSVIAGKGSNFQNINSPQVVVKVGETNSQGIVEISDIMFSTIGPSESRLSL